MRGLQVLQFGLFLLMLGFSVMLFCYGLIAASVSLVFVGGVDSLATSGKFMLWGASSILIGVIVSALGKLLCVGAPEEGARTLIVASLVCDFVITGIRVAWVTGTDVPFGGWFIFILGFVSYFTFLKFLVRMGDNVGEPRVGQYVAIIYGGIGGSLFSPVLIFFSFEVFLLSVCAGLALTTFLYNYTIFTLFRALPLYLEEVKMGITDPTESGEERKEKERKERIRGPGGGGPSQSKAPEEPKGDPPPGHLLYRIPKGIEALHMAVKEGDAYKTELRLSHGDDPRKPVRHGLTPMHIAASVGVMNVADVLLKCGAPIDDICEKGLTPIYFAVQSGNPNMVGFLVNRGANLFHKNDDGYTPLHWACCAPHPGFIGPVRVKMVTLLISQGADINATTLDGKTPRQLALDNQLEETVMCLDRHLGNAPAPAKAVKPDSSDSEDGSEEEEAPPAFTPFLGLELSVIPKKLEPLHEAVKDGDAEKVQRRLFEMKDDVNLALPGGIASVHITAISGVMSVTEMLIRCGATVHDTYDHNLTPIFLAVHLNNVAMVGYLINRGADVNHRDALGRSPLHWAAAAFHEKLEGGNRVKMVKFLLDQNADMNLQDNEGLKPRDLAEAAGYDDVVTLFDDLTAPAETADSGGGGDDDYYV